MSSQRSQQSAAINHLYSNWSASPSADVYSTAMPRPSSNMQSSVEAGYAGIVRPRRPLNLPAGGSMWNAPYGNSQPVSMGRQHPRNIYSQQPQRPLPVAAYDFERLSSQTNPFDADFQGAQHFAPSGASASYDNHLQGRQGSSQPTPRLHNPNVHRSQQLGQQSNLYGYQQGAGATSGEHLDYGASPQPMGHIQMPSMYTTPEVVPQYVQHGHHYTAAENSSQHQHVDQSLHMGGAMMHEAPGQFYRGSPLYVNVDNLHPEPSPYPDGPDKSHFDTGSSHTQPAKEQLRQESISSLSGTKDKGAGSQPHHGETLAHGKEARKPRGTEATCHMDGHLFHRTNPEDDWEPAVKHSAIFDDLLRWAKRNSRYRVPQVKSKISGDETAPVAGHETWGPARNDRPAVLFKIEKPKTGTEHTGKKTRWTWQGRRVLDRQNQWMWNWDDMPVTISSLIEGWHIEALTRRNPDMDISDFLARMLDGTPFIRKPTTLTNRTMRFRDRSWNYNWGIRKASSDAHLLWLKSVLPEECIKANSTRRVRRDPTQEEEKELQAFSKRTQAEKDVILAQRKRVRAQLLRPRTAMASSSVAPMALNTSALNPMLVKGDANTRKRQRRDSMQSSTSDDINNSALKRQKLQSGASAIRDDEQICSNVIPPAHKRQGHHNDRIGRANHRSHGSHRKVNEPDRLDSLDIEHRHGLMPTGNENCSGGSQHQYFNQDAGNQWMHEERQHPNGEALSTAYQPMLGHPQQQDRGNTYDGYHLDPELNPIDNAEDNTKDASSSSYKPGNTAFDQAQEQINLEAGQPQPAADDIDYMNDIQNAPADFWDAVDTAAHQLQVEHVPVNDDQRKILSTLALVKLEVGKSYMCICLEDRKGRTGLVDATSRDLPDELSIETAIHEIAHLAAETYLAGEPDRQAASQKAKDKQPETNAEQQFRPVYLPVDKTHIIVCIETKRAYEGFTAAEEETLWNAITLEAVVEALGDRLIKHRRPDRYPTSNLGNDQGFQGIWTENAASSTARNSSPFPSQNPFRGPKEAAEAVWARRYSNFFQPTEKKQAITNDAEASFDRLWNEWTGDNHCLPSAEYRAAFAARYSPLVI